MLLLVLKLWAVLLAKLWLCARRLLRKLLSLLLLGA